MSDPTKADLVARLEKIQSVGGSLLSNATAALKAAEALVPDPASPVVDPPPTVPPVVDPPAWPDASNTGVPAGMVLTVVSGGYSVPAGQTVTGLDIQGSVSMGAGSTLLNSRVRGVGENDWILTMGAGCTIRNVEIGGGVDGATFSNAIGVLTSDASNVIDKVHIHHTSDGLRNDGGTVTDSYVHTLKLDGGVHSDASQSTQQRQVTYRHCTIEGGNNDAIFIQACDGFTVDSCLLLPVDSPSVQSSYGIGGGNAQCLGPIAFTNNVFGGVTPADGKQGSFQVGCIQQGTWPAGTVQTGNTYLDGTPI